MVALAASAAPGAWKWAVRKRIWDLLEATNQADSPRPVHHRIPNFKGADAAAARLAALPEFVAASTVKVNPDTPQRAVRQAALAAGKTLLTPQPRLRTGFFNTLSAANFPATDEALREASTSAGVCCRVRARVQCLPAEPAVPRARQAPPSTASRWARTRRWPWT